MRVYDDSKPVGWLKPVKNIRGEGDQEELRHLGESLKVRQLQPVVARPDGSILFGHRRHAAALMVGLKTLQVVVTDEELSESDIRVMQLTENIHRTDLTDPETYRACEELLKLNAWKGQELAAHLGKSASWVTRALSPRNLIPCALEAFLGGALPLTVAYSISKNSPEEQHAMLAARRNGASRDELEASGRKARNGKDDTPPTPRRRVVCLVPGRGVTITIAGSEGKDLTMDESIAAGDQWVKDLRAARAEKVNDLVVFAKMSKAKDETARKAPEEKKAS